MCIYIYIIQCFDKININESEKFKTAKETGKKINI